MVRLKKQGLPALLVKKTIDYIYETKFRTGVLNGKSTMGSLR